MKCVDEDGSSRLRRAEAGWEAEYNRQDAENCRTR